MFATERQPAPPPAWQRQASPPQGDPDVVCLLSDGDDEQEEYEDEEAERQQEGEGQQEAPPQAQPPAAECNAAGDGEEPGPESVQSPWLAFPSLAWSKGREPTCGVGIQVHKKHPGFVVQIPVPAQSTGNVVPAKVGVFSSREHAARARDVVAIWRIVHSVCNATWETAKLCYPDAGYRQDAGLRAAVKAAPTWQELRSLMKATFPPPARIPGARQRSRSPPPRAARRAGQASALGVTKRISASILRFWRLCFTVEDLRQLGWEGSAAAQESPTLMAAPAAAASESGGSGGGSGAGNGGAAPGWTGSLELGKFGRDGALAKTTHVKVLVDRLGLELGDTLHLRPRTCPKSDDSQPGIIPVEVSLTKQPAQDPQQPPQQQQQQRQQGAAGAAAAAPPPAAPSPKACANCGATQTCAWMRNPADRSQHLCAACHQYSRRHNGQVRPQALWSKLPAKRSAEEAVDLPQPPHPEQQQPAKQPKLQQAAAAVKQEQPAAEVPVATPAGKQPAPVAEPASGGPSSAAAGAAPPPATATSSSLLAPDADWSLVYARLNELLHECGVPDEAAQDFKLLLLSKSEAVRRSHFVEVQACAAAGKPALAQRWVACTLGQQQGQRQG